LAYINAQAKYPDGQYDFVVHAKVFGELSPDQSVTVQAIVDNFAPYLSTVVLSQNGGPVYAAAWPVTPQNATDLGALIVSQSLPLSPSNTATIRLTFSEAMNMTVQPTVVITSSAGSETLQGTWTSPMAWEADGVNMSLSYSGTNPLPVQLSVSGAQDLAGNNLDSNPKTIAYRDANGNWQNADTGPDLNFVFQKGFQRAFVQAVTVSQNATPVYQAQWPLAPPTNPTVYTDSLGAPVTILANAPTVKTNLPAQPGVGTHFDIHFNNPMDPKVVPTVVALFYNQGVTTGPTPIPVPIGSWGLDGLTYSTNLAPNFLPTPEAGSITLSIGGALDAEPTPLAMDGNPGTIAYKDANGIWHGVEAEPDTANGFVIAAITPTAFMNDSANVRVAHGEA
jgi:hypothetical protein